MENHSFLTKLINRQVKVLYLDNGETKAIVGILNDVDPEGKYIVVNDVIVGLGTNFISIIPRGGNDARL